MIFHREALDVDTRALDVTSDAAERVIALHGCFGVLGRSSSVNMSARDTGASPEALPLGGGLNVYEITVPKFSHDGVLIDRKV